MASRIQGITVEIGGDTTKLSSALLLPYQDYSIGSSVNETLKMSYAYTANILTLPLFNGIISLKTKKQGKMGSENTR